MHHQYAHVKMAPTFSEFSFYKTVIEKKTGCEKHSVPKNYLSVQSSLAEMRCLVNLKWKSLKTSQDREMYWATLYKNSHGTLKNGWEKFFSGPENSLGVLRNAQLRGLNVWFSCALSVDVSY